MYRESTGGKEEGMNIMTKQSDTNQKDMERLRELRGLIMHGLPEVLGEEYEAKEADIVKNNGLICYGISVSQKGSNVAATVYTEDFADEYFSERKSIEEITNRIAELVTKEPPVSPKMINDLSDYSAVREKLRPMLVNYEANREELRECPHERFLDLAVILYVDLMNEIGGTVKVTGRLLEKWGVEEREAFSQAFENLRTREKSSVRNLGGILREAGIPIDLPEENCLPMYIITNQKKQFGAVYLTDENLLGMIAEKLDSDLLIYPSSVHELIVCSARLGFGLHASDIRDINREAVDQKEWLSASVYRYDRSTGKTTILEQGEAL